MEELNINWVFQDVLNKISASRGSILQVSVQLFVWPSLAWQVTSVAGPVLRVSISGNILGHFLLNTKTQLSAYT